jgi:hypothetical protein
LERFVDYDCLWPARRVVYFAVGVIVDYDCFGTVRKVAGIVVGAIVNYYQPLFWLTTK